MRRFVIALCCLCGLAPGMALAAGNETVVLVARDSSVTGGGTETFAVSATDLTGSPLRNASATLTVTYPHAPGRAVQKLHKTDATGHTAGSVVVPRGILAGTATATISVASGYLQETAATTFKVLDRSGTSPQLPATPHPTMAPTARTATTETLVVHAHILPADAVAPQPVWLVIGVSNTSGKVERGASVTVIVHFSEGSVTAHGVADGSGTVTLRVDTGLARKSEHVLVQIAAWSGKSAGKGVSSFSVARTPKAAAPAATDTPTPTDIPTGTPTSSPTPIFTDTPTDTPQPLFTPTPYPTLTDVATPTPFPEPTSTAIPTPTLLPTWTAIPTSTPLPLPTATASVEPSPTWTPAPSPTWTQTANCPGSQDGCIHAALNLINSTRAQYGLPPYTLNMTQSDGITGKCVGSVGHSIAMAGTGSIWHVAPGDDPQNPTNPASFWNDVCIAASYKGENVGQTHTGDEYQDITWIHQQMMSEQHDAAFCSVYDNHACNILSTTFHQVGIGLYNVNGTTWFTTDFMS
jgi:hypothetical protein